MSSKTLIQSYINSKVRWYFVSTIHRESSVAMIPTPWFYETIAWEWDSVTRERGKMIAQEGAPDNISSGLMSHQEVCKQLLLTDKYVENEEHS